MSSEMPFDSVHNFYVQTFSEVEGVQFSGLSITSLLLQIAKYWWCPIEAFGFGTIKPEALLPS